MRKAMTRAIIIRVLGDKDRGKASRLATRLAEMLDPIAVKVAAPTRTAELRVVGIDISDDKEELREAHASATGCGSSQIQVGEIDVSRGGHGSAWVKCPVAGAPKIAQDGKIKLGWSIARIIENPKRPLQCFRCLEIEHVRATCESAVDRAHLCYRKRTSRQKMSRGRAQVPLMRVARGASQSQNVRSGMRSAKGQEEKTHSPTSCGDARREHRQSSGRWTGGGHGSERVSSNASFSTTWEGLYGRRSCSCRLSGRARSPLQKIHKGPTSRPKTERRRDLPLLRGV
jgi:hypothetical protein